MASIEPGGAPVLLSEEPMRLSVADQFAATGPTPPIAGCGPGRTLELGCFFDGTRNNRWAIDEGSSETNVVRLHDAYVTGPRANDAAERDKHYLIGVGGRTAPEEHQQPTVGTSYYYAASTGFGGKHRVNLMYEWVKAKIEAHCRTFAPGSLKLIDIFGFSRGALSARTFVNLVNQALKTEPGDAFRNIEVRFLGVFDTVESLHEWGESPNCHVTNSDYRAARHFTARHEIRVNFPLTLLDPGAQSVEYPGTHSDVGGGWAEGTQDRPNWLSYLTCYDMAAACRTQGIQMNGIPIPPGCDVGPSSVMRTGSDEELRRSFVHVSHGSWPNHPEELPRANARQQPILGVRRVLRTSRMRLASRPPGFSWS